MITIEEARSLRADAVSLSRVHAETACYAFLQGDDDSFHEYIVSFAQQAGYIKALDEVLK